MTKSSSKKSRQVRNRNRAGSGGNPIDAAKKVPAKRQRNLKTSNSASEQPSIPVLFVSLDRWEHRNRGRVDDISLTNVEVPPPIVVPLDNYREPKKNTNKSPSKPSAVPVPIVVPLDPFHRRQKRRGRRRQNSSKASPKPNVPPPIYIPLEKSHQTEQKRKKKESLKPAVPPPIAVPLDGLAGRRNHRKK